MSEDSERTDVGSPQAGAQASWLREAGAAALTICIALLLIDAAIETFLDGAPLKWVLGGLVVGYFAFAVSGLRRRPWTARAAFSVLVSSGILALCSWQPEGLARGVVVLRQPTSTVLAVVTTMAVLFAGVVLVRGRPLPAWAKMACTVLVVYGAGAFVAGILAGTPYPDLFRGRGQWDRLPFWLQGPFVSALVLIPFALLVELIRSISRIKRRVPGTSKLRIAVLGLSVVLATAGLRAPEGSSATGSTPRLFLPRSAMDRGATIEAARRLLEHVDATPTDIEAAARSVGSNPAALLAFVRTLAFDPYRGCLRGPQGTLAARAGNALDRSLLLVALLRHHGHRARLAHARLADEDARRLLALVARQPAEPPWPERSVSVEDAARISGVPADELRSLRHAVESKGQELRRIVRDRVGRDVAYLRDHLVRSDIRLRAPGRPRVDDVRDHVWVQVETAEGWRDLDSLAPQGQPGERLAEPEGTVSPEALPEAWMQTLGLRLVASYRTGAELKDDLVLDVAFRVCDLVGRWLTLGFQPADGGGPPLPETASAFQPVLIAHDRQHKGRRVYLDGSLASGEGPAGLFGGSMGGAAPRPLERLRLEFTLSAPGQHDVHITRTIVHPPARPGADAAARTQEARMQIVSLYHFVATAGPFPVAWLAALHLATQRRIAAGHDDAVPFDLLHLADATARSAATEILGQPGQVRRYYTRPLLLGQRIRFRTTPEGRWAMVKSVDILQNRREFVSDDPMVAVTQGVLDTHLERVLFEGMEVANTTVVFERARAPILVLHGGTAVVPDGLALRPEGRAEIQRDLVAGYAVVVPTAGVSIGGVATSGWWRVHPDGGDTLGRMEDGEGQGMIERIILSLPSVYATGAGLLCRKEGLTRGPCDACFITVMGGVGVVLGFASIVYALAEEASYALWVLLRLSGGVGAGMNITRCLQSRFRS